MSHRVRQLGLGGVLSGLMGLWLATLAWAGTTGKVAGTTTDANGAPLPGVAVTVEGTRLGATTDPDGQYIILQVPPGEHTVTAQLVGYRPTSVTAVRVNADRTTQVSFSLQEEAIQVQALVVTAERPPIQVDVTSSQTTLDAASMAEAPVSKMLDMLNYEPGVVVNANNQLEIRGGGPSEVRFRVDGMDRTDASTGNSFTQLNQTLVSEVTVLTGGFNAEYGNVRSGVVNAVMKDGTERSRRGGGLSLPWVSAVSTYAPAQPKHFGPNAYSENQYNYWVALRSDSASGYAAMYWPDLYDETRTAPEFTDKTNPKYRDPHLTLFKVFDGWTSRAAATNALGIRKGAYGKKDWTPKEAREAWQWEANMNEQVWGYSNEPDRSLDASAGWGLPRKLGGLVVGYRYDKQMTAVPALRPYSLDQSLEGKLTLTPTDNFKMAVSFVRGETHSTGAAGGGYNADAELVSSTGQVAIGGDPVLLRGGSGDLISGVNGLKGYGNNRLNLSYNGFLDALYTQYGTSVTYAISQRTFATAGLSWSHSDWNLRPDLPRVDITNFSTTTTYRAPTSFNYRDWLIKAFAWSDKDGNGTADAPASLEDALTPGRALYVDPFSFPDAYSKVPSKTKYVTDTLGFIGTDGKPDTAVVVSPQGWIQEGYYDLSGQFWLGEGGEVRRNGRADQIGASANITHATGSHTLRSGFELIRADIEYHDIEGSRLMGSRSNTNFRDYGGDWPAARPTVLATYFQDKFESFGMIANLGMRVERFDAGQNQILANHLFDTAVINAMGKPIFDSLCVARGWNVATLGPVPVINLTNYALIKAQLGDATPTVGDVIAAYPQKDNVVYWRVMPRFGISHPVSLRTKFFFNYGIFYSMQKPAVLYGVGTHDGRTGKGGTSRFEGLYNSSLRPAKTTMYEVGVEHVLPLGFLTTVRGYAKYNVDQVSSVVVELATGNGYAAYRNSNYENLRGVEIRLSRSGRFLSGFVTAERFASRAGQTGLQNVRQNNSTFFTAFVNANQPRFTFEGLLHLGTPSEWGQLAGGWGVSIVQSYTGPGGEAIYNPNNLERRDIPDENVLSYVADYRTNLKFSKRFSIGRRRQLSAYMDVTNLLNQKTLSQMPQEYFAYVVQERRTNKSLKLGDSSTFHVFTEPYKDAQGNWLPPIAPSMDWLLYMYPRAYRFGISVDL